eukprot:SAG31_NODE_2873_length_4972_cov_3.088241_7_plen_246_part_00
METATDSDESVNLEGGDSRDIRELQQEAENDEHGGLSHLNGYGVGSGAMSGVVTDEELSQAPDLSQESAERLAQQESSEWLQRDPPQADDRTERRMHREQVAMLIELTANLEANGGDGGGGQGTEPNTDVDGGQDTEPNTDDDGGQDTEPNTDDDGGQDTEPNTDDGGDPRPTSTHTDTELPRAGSSSAYDTRHLPLGIASQHVDTGWGSSNSHKRSAEVSGGWGTDVVDEEPSEPPTQTVACLI